MILSCLLSIAVNIDGLPFIVEPTVNGKLLGSSGSLYKVDFSKGLSSFNLVGKPEDYSNVLIKKEKCIKGDK